MPTLNRTLTRWTFLILLVGCEAEKPSEPNTATPAPAAKPSAAPAAVPVGTKRPSTRPKKTVAQRRARYDARKTVAVPKDLPKAWQAALQQLDGRVTDVAYETWASKSAGLRHLSFKVRMWGEDAAVDKRVLAALKAAGVPQVGAKIPESSVTVKDVAWKVEINHMVAPKGEPREALVAFDWDRAPKAQHDRQLCTTPDPVAAPAELPRWLATLTKKQFLRRRVGVRVGHFSDGPQAWQYVLYRNGYALDDNVGAITAKLKKSGYHHDSGEGPRQRWTLPDGSRVSWRTTREDPVIGCTPEGPMLILEWKGPTP